MYNVRVTHKPRNIMSVLRLHYDMIEDAGDLFA